MKKRNNLEKTFGPLSFSGRIIFVFILGGFLYELGGILKHISALKKNNYVITAQISDIIIPILICALFLLVFAFLGFTTSCSIIDYKKKRIKYATKLCGIISIGKWTYLTSDMKLGIKKSNERWGAYNRYGASTSLEYSDLIITLYDNEDTEIIPVKKIKKAKYAETELEKLSKWLELTIIQ